MPTWCYCFLAYVAAKTSDPITRDQLAYARLIIKQAQSQGGLAWLDYDKSFRQQKAADPSMQWNAINPSLLASTMLGHRSLGSPSFCTLCRAVDHTRARCALAYLEPPNSTQVAPQRGPTLRKPHANPPVCFSWNRGSCPYGTRCNFPPSVQRLTSPWTAPSQQPHLGQQTTLGRPRPNPTSLD